MNTGDEERQAVEELLPWYAAGTLDPRDVRRVEDAIARDPALSSKYELVREELTSTVHLNETLGVPSVRAMDKLFASIDAEPARRHVRSADIAERISAFLRSLSPRKLAWATIAAALVIVVQTGVIGGVLLNQASGPTTLASGPTNATAQGAFALIRFAADASAADITALLEANRVSIADGPTAGGIYRIRAVMPGLPKEELAKLIEQLQQDKAVSFIAPTE